MPNDALPKRPKFTAPTRRGFILVARAMRNLGCASTDNNPHVATAAERRAWEAAFAYIEFHADAQAAKDAAKKPK